MSEERNEPGIWTRVDEAPTFSLDQVKEAKPRDLVYRFLAGALTSAVAAGLTLLFGARVGGVMLAFPAILAASLTLIAEDEDRAHAREDSRGAILGAAALAAFAATAALSFGELSAALALTLSTLVWAGVAIGGYTLIWKG
jgi:Protein of unknown function (DUF3147)